MTAFDYRFPIALGFGFALTLSVCTALMKSDVDAGDILSACGALLGSGFAVFGAIAVDRAKVRHQSVDDLRLLADALDRFEYIAAMLPVPEDFVPTPGIPGERQRAFWLINAMASVEHVLERVPPRDVTLWSVISLAVATFPTVKTAAEKLAELPHLGPVTLEDRALIAAHLPGALTSLRHYLRSARKLAQDRIDT